MPKLKEIAELTHQHNGIFLIDTVTGLGGKLEMYLLFRSHLRFFIIVCYISVSNLFVLKYLLTTYLPKTILGIPVKIDEWGIDAAFSGTQKCIGVPPCLSPVTMGPR